MVASYIKYENPLLTLRTIFRETYAYGSPQMAVSIS